jgi:hypothetical protein
MFVNGPQESETVQETPDETTTQEEEPAESVTV